MTVSKSPRLGLTRWDADTDPWLRSDWDGDNAQLEALAAMAVQGTLATRPAPDKRGRFYYATDTTALFYDTGTAWVTIVGYQPASDASPTLSSGITETSTGSSRVYRRDGMGWLGFSLTTDGAGPVAGRVILTVPAGFRPARDVVIQIRGNSRYTATLSASTGALTMLTGGSATVNTLEGNGGYPLP